jgi:diphthine-ammonia ligase
MSSVAIAWTGGKDSSLALHEAEASGCRINSLVTFAPTNARFLAHPLTFMRLQAQALSLPHRVIEVEAPYERSYENAILSLKKEHGIDALVTGDIDEVVGQSPDWMLDRGVRCGVDVLRPLWQRDRFELLYRFISLRFRAIFSCVKMPWFTEEWLGTGLSHSSIERLRDLSKRTELDVCGERGEYHTMVLDGPLFRKRVEIVSYSKHADNSTMYLSFENLRLTEKDT